MEDGNSFLSVLTGRSVALASFGEADVTKIQSRLWSMLGRQTEAYTLGDSGSIRIETAQELLESICYVIGLSLETNDQAGIIRALLDSENYEEHFRAGLAQVEARVQSGRALLKEVREGALRINNISYLSTLKELAVFFKKYNYRLFAHEIPCTIDYQLFQAVPDEKKGIDYINEYLRRLILENRFVRLFDEETVVLLLKSVCRDYREQLINIYEPVAYNALALTLLGHDVMSLDITKDDRLRLHQLLMSKKEKALTLFEGETERLCDILSISDEGMKTYLKATAAELCSRINSVKLPVQFDGIFPSLYREQPEKTPSERYIDGETMDNEELRSLIDEINGCRFVSDKIVMVKRNVRSLRDYAEILNVCFWDEECTDLFKTLENEEILLLLRYIASKRRRMPQWQSETGWETKLEEYVRNMDKE